MDKDTPFYAVKVEVHCDKGICGMGTGFIVYDDETSSTLLLTNWHVVTLDNFFGEPRSLKVPKKIVARLPIIHQAKPRMIGWKTVAIPIYGDDFSPKWLLNESYNFEQGRPLGDVVAFKLDGIGEFEHDQFFSISVSEFGRSPNLGDRIAIVGYPENLSASAQVSIPFVKTAWISSSPQSAPQDIDLGEKKIFTFGEGFFTDGNTSSGMSGAPVFHEDGALVGIYSGRLNPTEAQIGIVWNCKHILAAMGRSIQF